MAARKIEVQITGSSSGFEKALSRSGSAASSWGAKVGKTIAVGAVAAGTALAGLGGFAVKAAVDFESSFAGVRKTVDGTEKDFAKLSKGFLDLSRRIPVNVNELNRIGEAAGQLGIKKKNILEFTETIAKLGVSSNLAGEEGAAMLARFANITQLPQDQFDNLGAAIVALGNAGASTEAEIAEMGLRIAAAGKQVGFTQPQILGLANALSSVGVQAEAGGTAISTAMITIEGAVRKGGDKLDQFARVAGMSAQAFAKRWREDPSAALTAFVEGLGRIQKEGGNTFKTLDDLSLGGIRVRDSLLRLAGAGDLLRDSLKLGEKAWRDNIALNKEAEQRFKTTASQLQLLKNNIGAVAIVAGSELLPALNKALLAVTGFASDFFAAKGMRAKLNVVWEGVQEAGGVLSQKVGEAVAMIDWAAVWGKARGIGEGLAARFEATDWSAVGASIGSGIAAGVGTAGQIGKKLADAATAAVRSINWEQLGLAMGPGLAAAVLTASTTLMDPGFWARNWELSLGVALAAFTGPIGRLGSKLIAPLTKVGGDMVLAIVGGIEKFSPRIASVLLSALTKLPGVVARALAPLGSLVERTFNKIGSTASFVVKVLGIAAVANAVASMAVTVAGKLKATYNAFISSGQQWVIAAANAAKAAVDAVVRFIGELPGKVLGKLNEVLPVVIGFGPAMAAAGASIAGKLVGGILGGLAGLPGALAAKLGGYIRQAVSWAGGLLRGSGDFMFTKHTIGKPMAQGVMDGWMLGMAGFGAKVAESLRATIETRTAALTTAAQGLSERLNAAFGTRTQQMLSALGAKFDEQIQKVRAWQAELTGAERALQGMTASEKALADLDAAEGERGRQMSLVAAQEALAKAQSIENAEERATAILAAEEQLRSAQLAITRQRLTEQAAAERTALQAKAAEERTARDAAAAAQIVYLEETKARELKNLEELREIQGVKMAERLAELVANLAKHPKEWDKTQKAIIKLLAGYGIDYKNSGEQLGKAFAWGLKRSEKEVENAAKGLAKIPSVYLRLKSPAEKGPLSDDPRGWLRPLGPMLAAGMRPGAVEGAASRMASAVTRGFGAATMNVAGGTGAPGGYATATRGGSAAVVLNVHFDGQVFTDDVDRFAEQLYGALARVDRNRGGRMFNALAPVLN